MLTTVILSIAALLPCPTSKGTGMALPPCKGKAALIEVGNTGIYVYSDRWQSSVAASVPAVAAVPSVAPLLFEPYRNIGEQVFPQKQSHQATPHVAPHVPPIHLHRAPTISRKR